MFNEDGEEVLAPDRQAKLEKELEEIDNAVQYALIASRDGYYPCYTCSDGTTTIFLRKFEIWRYGTTRKGENGRYPNGNFGAPHLLFIEQFEGAFSECLKIEKLKIYNYPLLPEAKRSGIILFRPPGNKNDG